MSIVVTRADIIAGLKRIGLQRGMAVEVHSSLRSVGHVEGGPPTVIQALIEVVGEGGAIVMSAFPLTLPIWPTEAEKARGIVCKLRILDENDNSRTGMGVVSDAFKKWPDVCLGKGIYRVCAWGKEASLHAQGYDYLLSVDGWALLIGVDIHRCTAMHTAESKVHLPDDIEAYFKIPEAISRDYPPDQWYIQYHDPPEDAWGKIQDEAEQRGLIRRGKIGTAECMFFQVKPVVDIYLKRLQTDPHELFGLQK